MALSKYKLASQSIPESYALWNNVGMCFYGKQKFVAVSYLDIFRLSLNMLLLSRRYKSL